MDNREYTVFYRFSTASNNVTVIIQTCYNRVALTTVDIIINISTATFDGGGGGGDDDDDNDDDDDESVPILGLF
jgi:hypothetical protein